MDSVPAREIKRRGMVAVDEALREGPVHVIRDDEARYVILRTEDYQALLNDLAEARLQGSEADVSAGRIRMTTPKKLLAEIEK